MVKEMNSLPPDSNISEPERLLNELKHAPFSEHPRLLVELASSLSQQDPFTIAHYGHQLKAMGLTNKTELIQAIKNIAKNEILLHSENPLYKPTDDELADRWVEQHPDTAYGLGGYRRYENGVWPVVERNIVEQEVLRILEKAKMEGVRPSQRLLNSVIELGRVKVSVSNNLWDAHHEYLPLVNGVLHIPTRKLLENRPDYYFTTGLYFDYSPEAICPNFLHVLNTTIPAEIEFLQEFAGYSLTTDTRFEIAIWLYGPPGSGKSTILTGLQSMLGPRAGILGLADIERSRFSLTNVIGKTMLVSTEQPSMYLSATHVLDAIISGEPISIDRKFRDPIKIIPHAKMAWSMNELPRIKDPGNGIFRRVKVIKFPHLDERKRDPALKEAIKREGPGILNWALDGLFRLLDRGRFDIPVSVRDATADFQSMNDIPSLFVADKCITGLDYKTQSSNLYQAYKLWCLDNGHQPQSSTSIAQDWRRLGFIRYEANGRKWWSGVGLRD